MGSRVADGADALGRAGAEIAVAVLAAGGVEEAFLFVIPNRTDAHTGLD